jgi:hypothetical protein
MSNVIELSTRTVARPAAVLPPGNVAEIKKLPYNVTRGAHSRKPRHSKNGTPQEREAKIATVAAATDQPPRQRAGMLDREFEAKIAMLDEYGRQYITGYMQALLDQRGKQ